MKNLKELKHGKIFGQLENFHWTINALKCILKTLILPKVSHLLSVCYCPYNTLKQVDKLFFEKWQKIKEILQQLITLMED